MTDSTGITTFCQAQTSQTKPNQDRHRIAGTLTSQSSQTRTGIK